MHLSSLKMTASRKRDVGTICYRTIRSDNRGVVQVTDSRSVQVYLTDHIHEAGKPIKESIQRLVHRTVYGQQLYVLGRNFNSTSADIYLTNN